MSKWNPNFSTAIVFVDAFYPHNAAIVYESADIQYYRDDLSWIECGEVVYDTIDHEIISRGRIRND